MGEYHPIVQLVKLRIYNGHDPTFTYVLGPGIIEGEYIAEIKSGDNKIRSNSFKIPMLAINDCAERVLEFESNPQNINLDIPVDEKSIFQKDSFLPILFLISLQVNICFFSIYFPCISHYILPFFICIISVLIIPFSLNKNCKISKIKSNRINARTSKHINNINRPVRFLKYDDYILEPQENPIINQELNSENQFNIIAKKKIKFNIKTINGEEVNEDSKNEDNEYSIPEQGGIIITEYQEKSLMRYKAELIINNIVNGNVLKYENNDIQSDSFVEQDIQFKRIISKFGYHYSSSLYAKEEKDLTTLQKYRIITILYLEWITSITIKKYSFLRDTYSSTITSLRDIYFIIKTKI